MVDINVVLTIPPILLQNLKKHPQLADYIINIDETKYASMMSHIFSIILSHEHITPHDVRDLERIQCFTELSDTLYDVFLEVFRCTLDQIVDDEFEVNRIMNRLTTLLVGLKIRIHSPNTSGRLSKILHEVETVEDLNVLRQNIIDDLKLFIIEKNEDS